jgi:hypothetical protein
MKCKLIISAALLLSVALCLLSMSAWSQCTVGEAATPANITKTNVNGSFNFSNLSAGCYNITAYRMILGAMHFLGDGVVTVPGNETNVSIKIARSDEAHYACFQNATVNLTPGNYTLKGVVLGPNRPGAEPAEIPYEDTLVKITAAT